MPCTDGTSSEERIQERELEVQRHYESKINTISAMLCGVLTWAEKKKLLSRILNEIDWKEAGITEDRFSRWWAKHKAIDGRRVESDRRIEKHRRLVASARKKLTTDELRAITTTVSGVKS
jgi:hypothetical protein